tara:strand:+ start:51 stop:518 length:468 start_codon:yes stop_codon:yes gene_type:complete
MMNDIEQKILSDYAAALAKWQIELYRGRNQRMDNPIQRYFNSTPVRNTFARMMFLAYQDDKSLYTKAEISRQLFITRQAASQMVEDCLAEGWIETCGNGYKASQVLADKLMDYTMFHIDTLTRNSVTDLYMSLRHYQRAQNIKASSDFTPKRVAS